LNVLPADRLRVTVAKQVDQPDSVGAIVDLRRRGDDDAALGLGEADWIAATVAVQPRLQLARVHSERAVLVAEAQGGQASGDEPADRVLAAIQPGRDVADLEQLALGSNCMHVLLFGYAIRRTPRRERKIAAELPRPPVTPNPARVCECGWTSYPQPQPAQQGRIIWTIAPACSNCGGSLEPRLSYRCDKERERARA
jgi:hypothetical protein